MVSGDVVVMGRLGSCGVVSGDVAVMGGLGGCEVASGAVVEMHVRDKKLMKLSTRRDQVDVRWGQPGGLGGGGFPLLSLVQTTTAENRLEL